MPQSTASKICASGMSHMVRSIKNSRLFIVVLPLTPILQNIFKGFSVSTTALLPVQSYQATHGLDELLSCLGVKASKLLHQHEGLGVYFEFFRFKRFGRHQIE